MCVLNPQALWKHSVPEAMTREGSVVKQQISLCDQNLKRVIHSELKI